MVSDPAQSAEDVAADGLNPCSNGIWSLTRPWIKSVECAYVLILVLMEYGL